MTDNIFEMPLCCFECQEEFPTTVGMLYREEVLQ